MLAGPGIIRGDLKTRQGQTVSGQSYLSTGEDNYLESNQAQSLEMSGSLHAPRAGGTIETSQAQTSALDGYFEYTSEDHVSVITSQAQNSEAYGTLTLPTVISGIIETSQAQTLAINTTEIAPRISAVIVTTQAQSLTVEGRTIPVQPQQPVRQTGSGVYHGPHGIPVNVDYINGARPVTEAEIPYTDFATFFGHNDGGELEKFLEINQTPKVAEDTSLSFLKSLPAPKFNRSMDFIKSLGAPSPQIIAETEAEITGEPIPVKQPEQVVESVKPKAEPKIIKEKVKSAKKDSFDMLWESTRHTGQMLQQAGKLLEAAVDPKRTEPVNIEDLTKAIAIVEDNIQKLKSKLPIL